MEHSWSLSCRPRTLVSGVRMPSRAVEWKDIGEQGPARQRREPETRAGDGTVDHSEKERRPGPQLPQATRQSGGGSPTVHMLVRRGRPGRVGAGRKLCEVLTSEGMQAPFCKVTAALWPVSIPRLFWAHLRLFLNEPLQCLAWFFVSLPPFLRRSLLGPAFSSSLVSFSLIQRPTRRKRSHLSG